MRSFTQQRLASIFVFVHHLSAAAANLPQARVDRGCLDRGRLVSELQSTSDAFESIRGDMVDEDLAADACEVLQGYSARSKGSLHESLLLDLVRPIVGLDTTLLCQVSLMSNHSKSQFFSSACFILSSFFLSLSFCLVLVSPLFCFIAVFLADLVFEHTGSVLLSCRLM